MRIMKIAFDIGEAYGTLLSKLLEQVNQMRLKQNLNALTIDQWVKIVFVNAIAQDIANVEAAI